jgi:hypothetical protein
LKKFDGNIYNRQRACILVKILPKIKSEFCFKSLRYPKSGNCPSVDNVLETEIPIFVPFKISAAFYL